MSMPIAVLTRSAAIAALLILGACGDSAENNLAELDNELLANGTDPALTSALEDQILVDPNLVQQSHPNSVRPPETPAQAQYPTGTGGGAAASGAGARAARVQGASAANAVVGSTGCGAQLDHGPQWAERLPAEFPPYPGGRVTEAAGTNGADCRMRVVTFRTGDAYARVLDHYRGLATRAGFSAEHQVRGADHLLGGVNERTDGAYVVIVTPRDRGSEVALVVNNGR